ncbi:MAG: hypothetical protein O7G87_19020 [bacterium]|nr:hypothetical protein [bacterium]
MYEGLIVRCSLGRLRQAAGEGRAYYSCERFEDSYGRLVVGIGARLEGRTLREVARTGRKMVYVSPVALCDGVRFRRALKAAGPPPDASVGFDIEAIYKAVSKFYPEAAKQIAGLKPCSEDVSHGVRVGAYVRRLMIACNESQQEGRIYSDRAMTLGVLAGVVHDIGCWGGKPVTGHAERGAHMVNDLIAGSAWVQDLSDAIAHHHTPLLQCTEKDVGTLYRIAPIIFAEAVLESVDGSVGAVHRLASKGVPVVLKDLLISLCNLEKCAPPLTVVRLQDRGRASGYDLAVSLQTEKGDVSGPYLLRFARLDIRGRPMPVQLEYRCLIGPGHPDFERGEQVVVGLLSNALYERLFQEYEGLIPVFRKVLSR